MNRMYRRSNHRRIRPVKRRGAILVLSVFLLIVMLGFVALSVDVGYINNVRTEMDRAVDACALAGAGALPNGIAAAEAEAIDFAQLNPVANSPLAASELQFEPGHWDSASQQFLPANDLPSAFRVSAQRVGQRPLFFANVFGRDEFNVQSSAIAAYQPRDIMVVLDYSASMNDDSEFRGMPVLGRNYIESNLATIYGELGSPVYGSLKLAPQWMKVLGAAPTNSYRPQLAVEYRYDSVYVTSTKPLYETRVYNGSSYQTSSNVGVWNAGKGVYELTMTYNGTSQITKVWVSSGYNSSSTANSNRYSEYVYFDSTSTIRNHALNSFGLNGASYPYPGGSWSGYVDYCISSSSYNASVGYRYRFGYMNLINYWLEQYPSYSDVPDLWKVSEQPITAVKNSVDVFLSFMQEMNTSDKVGLAVYNSSTGYGKLEQGLTLNYDVVGTISRHRQAGHYHSMTNIAAGIQTARTQLAQNARPGSLKLIVLMTDGVANYPNNSSYATDAALQEAQACANAGYPIITVSLGSGADTSIMQQIATMTGGLHFNVPGGQSVAEYEQDLKETFQRIAEERPLRLVE